MTLFDYLSIKKDTAKFEMETIKDLTTGKLSLSLTFWGYGILGNILLNFIVVPASKYDYTGALYVALFCRLILSIMVLSGITFILKNNKFMLWGIIAFAIFALQIFLLCARLHLPLFYFLIR